MEEINKSKSVDEAIEELNQLMNLEHKKGNYKYTDGWDPDKLEEELKQHPFFITEMPKEGEPVPPLIEAFQQLKYSPDENSPAELAVNHKEDGHFHFKLKKYRIAIKCYSEAIRYAEHVDNDTPDDLLTAQLYNNRAASQFRIENFGSALKDCEKAIKLKPDYMKPLLKAMECCGKLEKWDKILEFSELAMKIEKDNKQVIQLRSLATTNKRKTDAKARKEIAQHKKKDEHVAKILKSIQERHIKLKNDKFLSEDDGSGSKVVLTEDEKLEWPVLLYYPQYSQSDFVEAFQENATFVDHLTEILENDRPFWDAENEYHLDSIDVYFITLANAEYVKIDINQSLLTTMQDKRYVLPPNGVPAFVVLARNNEECNSILRRMKSS